ncbi:hypothetical protein U3516DRAFT_660332 [Neocallimastix sp. 'constans']
MSLEDLDDPNWEENFNKKYEETRKKIEEGRKEMEERRKEFDKNYERVSKEIEEGRKKMEEERGKYPSFDSDWSLCLVLFGIAGAAFFVIKRKRAARKINKQFENKDDDIEISTIMNETVPSEVEENNNDNSYLKSTSQGYAPSTIDAVSTVPSFSNQNQAYQDYASLLASPYNAQDTSTKSQEQLNNVTESSNTSALNVPQASYAMPQSNVYLNYVQPQTVYPVYQTPGSVVYNPVYTTGSSPGVMPAPVVTTTYNPNLDYKPALADPNAGVNDGTASSSTQMYNAVPLNPAPIVNPSLITTPASSDEKPSSSNSNDINNAASSSYAIPVSASPAVDVQIASNSNDQTTDTKN